MLNLYTPLEEVSGVGEKIREKLAKWNIRTVEDLLYHLPHRYEDFSVFKKINELNAGEVVTISGSIQEIKNRRTWKRKMFLTEALIADETGSIKAVWFNAPLPARYLRKGGQAQLSGKTTINKQKELILQHPNLQIISKKQRAENGDQEVVDSANTGGLAPVYPETKGLTSYWFRRTIQRILKQVTVEEILPASLLKEEKLLARDKALRIIHAPASQEEIERARTRFAFEKIFLLQLKFLQAKNEWMENRAVKISFSEKDTKQFLKQLPFQLTNAQKKASWEIIQDLGKGKPMNRLLEGDVGTGKTAVAAMAILPVIQAGFQVVLLAPTEVLATQHYLKLKEIFAYLNLEIVLLTGATVKFSDKDTLTNKNVKNKAAIKRMALEKIKSGESKLAIGTHALLRDQVQFKKLAFVIIDEQHRFGVSQRAYLQQEVEKVSDGIKQKTPHLLTMTATPIPRTLALSIFGNLDLSVIDEFPKGRKLIKTKVVNKKQRKQVYEFIGKKIISGRQAFVICPLVEETADGGKEVKAATEEMKRLQKEVFPRFKLGLLHGKMKPDEKNNIMAEFKERKIDILVSTSVVEVGVDVPNATIIMIEGAERFGLAQLHQFRGRVGRGKQQAYCFLATSENVPVSTLRLRILEGTNDGFKIAEADLKLRGPGQFLGQAQSGVPDVAMESLTNVKSIQAARDQALRVIAFDPKLTKFPKLKNQLEKLEKVAHWE